MVYDTTNSQYELDISASFIAFWLRRIALFDWEYSAHDSKLANPAMGSIRDQDIFCDYRRGFSPVGSKTVVIFEIHFEDWR